MYSNCYSSHNKIKLEFSRQIFEKFRSIKFTKNSSWRKKLLNVDRQTDRRTDTMILKFPLHNFYHSLIYGFKNEITAVKYYFYMHTRKYCYIKTNAHRTQWQTHLFEALKITNSISVLKVRDSEFHLVNFGKVFIQLLLLPFWHLQNITS
jgi:hypothetical protein